jgi:hypothetical protein
MKITDLLSPLFVLRCVNEVTGLCKVTLRNAWGMSAMRSRAMETGGECSIDWALM